MSRPDVAFDVPRAESLAADSGFWALYDATFPSSERDPHDVVLATIRENRGFAMRARTHERTCGLATAHLLRRPPVPFLVYLAVAPELRSHGVGGRLLERVWAHARECYAAERDAIEPEGLVWEVEIPERATDARDAGVRRRRIAFFERLGGRVCPGEYTQPPIDGATLVPMHLMFRPAPGRAFPDAAAIAALKRALYFEKYEAMNHVPRATLERLLADHSPHA